MIDGVPWGESTPWGLVGTCVLAICFGLLIPRWVLNKLIAAKDKEIALLTAALAKRDEQVDKLVDSQQLTIKLLEDIKVAGYRRTANRDT